MRMKNVEAVPEFEEEKRKFTEEARTKYPHGEFIPSGDAVHCKQNAKGEITLHPYDMSMEALEELINECKARGYRFNIKGHSCYYPGHTFCITFHKDENRVIELKDGETSKPISLGKSCKIQIKQKGTTIQVYQVK